MNGTVYALEDDASISGLIKVALQMNGIDFEAFSNIKDFNAAVDSLVKAPARSTNADQSNTGTANTAGAMGALMLMAAAGAMVIGYRRKRS